MKLLALALCLPFAACTVGDGNTGTTGDDDTNPNPNPDPNPNPNPNPNPTPGISGTIAANTTWSGPTAITGAVMIPAGITVTVSAGAALTLTASAGITINGILDIEGTKALPVTVGPDVAAGHWSGVDIKAGGTLTMKYGTQTGGGIYTDGGIANVTDSHMSNANGDYLVMNGGSVDIEYSTIGEETALDSTHCNLHFNSATAIKFTHNNNLNSPYGLMFYGGTGADFTHNNWISSKPLGDIDIEPNPGGTGDFSNSYFSNGQPAGVTGLTFTPLAPARLADCGPR